MASCTWIAQCVSEHKILFKKNSSLKILWECIHGSEEYVTLNIIIIQNYKYINCNYNTDSMATCLNIYMYFTKLASFMSADFLHEEFQKSSPGVLYDIIGSFPFG